MTEATPQPSARRKAAAPKTKPALGRLEAKFGQKALVHRWERAIDGADSIRVIAKGLGHSVGMSAGRLRVEGMRCLGCGIATITAKSCAALYINQPGSLPQDPHRLRCEDCGWNAQASQLLPILFESYAEREKFVTTHFLGHKPVPRDFYAAHLDGKTALSDRSHQEANVKVLPAEHGCEVDVCVIAALDQDMAAARLSEGNIPWGRVHITPAGKVVKTAFEAAERAEKEARIADELKQFEATLRKQLRL